MKLLFVTCLKDYEKSVASLLNEAGVHVFSVSETTGFKDNRDGDLAAQWFSRGNEQFDSVFLFSFTEEAKALKVVGLVRQYNDESKSRFPVHAFVMPVEATSHKMN